MQYNDLCVSLAYLSEFVDVAASIEAATSGSWSGGAGVHFGSAAASGWVLRHDVYLSRRNRYQVGVFAS